MILEICKKRIALQCNKYHCLECSCNYVKYKKLFVMYITPMKNGYIYPQESIKASMFTVTRYSKKQAEKAESIFWQVLESHIAIWKEKFLK